jgi:cell division protein FtsZ
MGAAIDETYRGKLAVTVIAAANILPRRVVPQPVSTRPTTFARPGDTVVSRNSQPAMTSSVTPLMSPPKPVAETVTTNEAVVTPKTRAKPKQETLPLEGVSRGRFDKSEPTLYNGEDLDVPTFIRRGVSLKR